MATPLPPRVSGPLTTASREVVVTGVDTGGQVSVFADGDEVGSGAAAAPGMVVGLSGAGSRFARVKLVTPLQQGSVVSARQAVDGATSEPSPVPVVVIGVPSQLPRPDVRTFPVAGVEAMLVRRLFPGADVTVRITRGGVDSFKTSNADDFEEVVLTPSPLRVGDSLQVIQRLGNQATGWSAPRPVNSWGGNRKAHLPTPIFELVPQACDRGIRLGNIVPGATAVVELNGAELRRRSVVNRVVVPVRSYITLALDDEPLAEGDKLVIWQVFPSTGQRTDPNESLVHKVGPAAPPARPILWEGICPHATEIIVTGYRPGARIRVYEAPPGSTTFTLREDLTHRAPLLEPDFIPIPTGFRLGGQLVATQEPCLGKESPRSFPITVRAVGTSFGATSISEPVVECADGVVANNLTQRASASIWSSMLGGPITPSRTVTNLLPNWFDALILPGDKLRIVQRGCVPAGAQQGAAVPVQPANGLPPALDYVFGGDRTVWAWCTATDAQGNVVPANGAEVEVFITRGQTRHWVGSGQSSGNGWAQVVLSGWTIAVDDEVTVTAHLCGDPIRSEPMVAIPPRPPRPPILKEPAPGSTTVLEHPRFSWLDPDAGTPYEALSFTFAIEEQGGSALRPTAHTEQTNYQWSGSPGLVAGRTYRWFVMPEGRRGQGQAIGASATVTRQAVPSPPPPPPPTQQGGFSKLVVWNCNSTWDKHANGGTVTVYVRDRAQGNDFQTAATLDVGYAEGGGSCGPGFSTGEEYELENGHVYDFVFLDPELPGCDGDPNTVACARLSVTGLVGRDNGPILTRTIG